MQSCKKIGAKAQAEHLLLFLCCSILILNVRNARFESCTLWQGGQMPSGSSDVGPFRNGPLWLPLLPK